MRYSIRLLFILLLAASAPGLAQADESFHCEVLAVEGNVRLHTMAGGMSTLKEGDLLSKGDSVEVPDDGSLDLAYDKEWNNVVRLEGGTKAKVLAISPAIIDLAEGAVYAKLKNLPAKSSFEVRTPTAVAAVRGTEYRTLVRDGETEVFNFSPSRVFVYGMDPVGVKTQEATVVEENQKTVVESRGEAPEPPKPMNVDETKKCESSRQAIETRISHAVTSGRVGKIQTVAEIEQSASRIASQARYDEESRVTDTRRRSFN